MKIKLKWYMDNLIKFLHISWEIVPSMTICYYSLAV